MGFEHSDNQKMTTNKTHCSASIGDSECVKIMSMHCTNKCCSIHCELRVSEGSRCVYHENYKNQQRVRKEREKKKKEEKEKKDQEERKKSTDEMTTGRNIQRHRPQLETDLIEIMEDDIVSPVRQVSTFEIMNRLWVGHPNNPIKQPRRTNPEPKKPSRTELIEKKRKKEEEGESAKEQKPECVVCYGDSKSVLHCGHFLCTVCHLKMLEQSETTTPELNCPTCRKPFEDTINLFYS